VTKRFLKEKYKGEYGKFSTYKTILYSDLDVFSEVAIVVTFTNHVTDYYCRYYHYNRLQYQLVVGVVRHVPVDHAAVRGHARES